MEQGRAVSVDAALARQIATAAYTGEGADPICCASGKDHGRRARARAANLARGLRDDKNSSFYVSGSTGELLEQRNDTWRLWDFFWMLHNMDYVNRTSFNHPMIVILGFAAVWLAITGLWLLFRTRSRSDFKHVASQRHRNTK